MQIRPLGFRCCSEPGCFAQGAVHPGLPAWPGFLEPGHHILIQTQRDSNLRFSALGRPPMLRRIASDRAGKALVKGRAWVSWSAVASGASGSLAIMRWSWSSVRCFRLIIGSSPWRWQDASRLLRPPRCPRLQRSQPRFRLRGGRLPCIGLPSLELRPRPERRLRLDQRSPGRAWQGWSACATYPL